MDVVLNLSELRYVGCDKIGEIFKNPRLLDADKVFQVENFEFSVSGGETEEEKEAERNFVEKLSSVCPHLRTVKLNINNESCNQCNVLSS